MTDLLLTGAVLLAQAAPCGTYGTPSSPGGCSLPAPNGGSYLLQTLQGGQIWVQETPGPRPSFNTYPNDTDTENQ